MKQWWSTRGPKASSPKPPLVRPNVAPSVLHPKSFTKICHEHHVYVLMHVIECVDKFLVTKNDQ